jgi:hypothetical protein
MPSSAIQLRVLPVASGAKRTLSAHRNRISTCPSIRITSEWVGYPIAKAIGLNLSKKLDKARVKSLIKIWLASGALMVVEGEDAKRNKRKFIEVSDN